MPPFTSRVALIQSGLVAGVWTIYGVLCACQSHYWYAFTTTPMSWGDSLRFECTYAWLWAAWTPLILSAARRFRWERGRWISSFSVHLSLMAVVVSFNRIVFDFITRPPHSMFQEFSWVKVFRSIESNFDTGVLLYAVVVLVEQALVLHARHRSEILKASVLQTRLVEAQLQALKMQLHPHFLFNTLHTITALIHEDPETAERMIARLGELLRLFLATTTVHEVPLSEELRILDLYLEIERARFEERLEVRYEVPDSLRNATVPNLVLQPLVENSIRHGIGRRSEPGWILIAAERDGDRLVLCVTDNGEGLPEGPGGASHQGTGLTITRGRLETLYGPNQSLVLRNVPSGGAEVRIALPYRMHSASYYEREHVELQSAHS
jgi:two-component system, LytTR family, sensor kinase